MAYVRKTDTLVQDIKDNVREMRGKALQAYPIDSINGGEEYYDAAFDTVLNAAYDEAPELKGKMPKAWLKGHDFIQVHFKNEDNEDLFDIRLRPANNDKLFLPAHIQSSYYSSSITVLPKHLTDKMRTWFDDTRKRVAKRSEVAEQYQTIEEQLTAFMRHHASLNAAIKEMPEMEMYVPEKYMEKMRAPTEPRRKKGSGEPTASEELGIDRNALATIAIAHRLQQ